MAISHLSSSSSSYLSLSHKPLIHFPSFIKPLKFTPFCTSQPNNTKTHDFNAHNKKKRKQKPSFNDQIRVKWSNKPSISSTKQFPWQIQQQKSEISKEFGSKVVEFQDFDSGFSKSSNLSDDLIGGAQIQQPIGELDGFSKSSNLSDDLIGAAQIQQPIGDFDGFSKSSNISDDLIGGAQIQQPIGDLDGNNVSVTQNFDLDNGLCIYSSVEKDKLIRSKKFNVVSKIVDCNSSVEESIEDSEITLSYDVDNALLKDNVVEVRVLEDREVLALSSSIYDDVDNANSKDNVVEVRKLEDSEELALSRSTYDVDNANLKNNVAEVRVLEDSEVGTLSSSIYDVDSANSKDNGAEVRMLEDSEVGTLSSSIYDVDSVNSIDNVAEVRVLEDSGVTLSSSKYGANSGNSGSGENFVNGKERLPWMSESDCETKQSRSKTKLAEETIPEHELKRLRNVALRMKERLKVGAAGVTQALVDTIHDKWKVDEVVKLKFEGHSLSNMKRIHDVLESKTGGLVIWRSGSSVVLFRGLTYNLDCVKIFMEEKKINLDDSPHPENRVSDPLKFQKNKSEEESTEITELNHMLDELGPRYVDWSGPLPLPVDADLLPPVVPEYKTPFRLRPYGVRLRLRDEETTQLRRTARITHPHFALGRNRELQGLAAAMVKLWEKSAVAKIAIKRGVLNTSNERMAEELKRLTGGTLLSRNKEYIVFYRGNDFLPPKVTESLKERERLSMLQYQEEEARRSALPLVNSTSKLYKVPKVAGTLAETIAATSQWGKQPSSQDVEKMMKDSDLSKRASLVKYLQTKLYTAKEKLKKAEKALEKVQGYLEPEELPTDLETITDEERLVFRRMGLSMKPFLLVGRREVFDGTIENIHLHWKFRELVKVVVKGKNFKQVQQVAISLEAESGGVLVSIDRTTKGYAIIIYRGKNYRQPIQLRPKNLLTKRQALARAIELQRREGLKHHISSLQEQMELLNSELEDMKNGREFDDKTFYEKLDNSSIPFDDGMEEGDDEEAYLQTYDSGDENGSSSYDELSQIED